MISFTFAQKSSYIKNRLTFNTSCTAIREIFLESHIVYHGFDIKANYGITKIWETGLNFYYVADKGYNLTSVGINSRIHVLPFLLNTDNRFFRFDLYAINQWGILFDGYRGNVGIIDENDEIVYIDYKSPVSLIVDVGLGASFFVSKNVGFNFEFTWEYDLLKKIRLASTYSIRPSVGLILKF